MHAFGRQIRPLIALGLLGALACSDDGTGEDELLRGEPEMSSFTLAGSEGQSFDLEGSFMVESIDPFVFRMGAVTVTGYFSHPPPVRQGEEIWAHAFSEPRAAMQSPSQMLALGEPGAMPVIFASYWRIFEPTAAEPTLPAGFVRRYEEMNDCTTRELTCGVGTPFLLEIDLDQTPRAALCPEHSASIPGWKLANGISERWRPEPNVCTDQSASVGRAGFILKPDR